MQLPEATKRDSAASLDDLHGPGQAKRPAGSVQSNDVGLGLHGDRFCPWTRHSLSGCHHRWLTDPESGLSTPRC